MVRMNVVSLNATRKWRQISLTGDKYTSLPTVHYKNTYMCPTSNYSRSKKIRKNISFMDPLFSNIYTTTPQIPQSVK